MYANRKITEYLKRSVDIADGTLFRVPKIFGLEVLWMFFDKIWRAFRVVSFDELYMWERGLRYRKSSTRFTPKRTRSYKIASSVLNSIFYKIESSVCPTRIVDCSKF